MHYKKMKPKNKSEDYNGWSNYETEQTFYAIDEVWDWHKRLENLAKQSRGNVTPNQIRSLAVDLMPNGPGRHSVVSKVVSMTTRRSIGKRLLTLVNIDYSRTVGAERTPGEGELPDTSTLTDEDYDAWDKRMKASGRTTPEARPRKPLPGNWDQYLQGGAAALGTTAAALLAGTPAWLSFGAGGIAWVIEMFRNGYAAGEKPAQVAERVEMEAQQKGLWKNKAKGEWEADYSFNDVHGPKKEQESKESYYLIYEKTGGRYMAEDGSYSFEAKDGKEFSTEQQAEQFFKEKTGKTFDPKLYSIKKRSRKAKPPETKTLFSLHDGRKNLVHTYSSAKSFTKDYPKLPYGYSISEACVGEEVVEIEYAELQSHAEGHYSNEPVKMVRVIVTYPDGSTTTASQFPSTKEGKKEAKELVARINAANDEDYKASLEEEDSEINWGENGDGKAPKELKITKGTNNETKDKWGISSSTDFYSKTPLTLNDGGKNWSLKPTDQCILVSTATYPIWTLQKVKGNRRFQVDVDTLWEHFNWNGKPAEKSVTKDLEQEQEIEEANIEANLVNNPGDSHFSPGMEVKVVKSQHDSLWHLEDQHGIQGPGYGKKEDADSYARTTEMQGAVVRTSREGI